MAEYFYREREGGSRRMVGPFADEAEARMAARYKGLRDVEVLKKSGANYDLLGGVPGAAKPGQSASAGRGVGTRSV
jgi:hypothetical protein